MVNQNSERNDRKINKKTVKNLEERKKKTEDWTAYLNLGLKVGTSVNIVDFFKELDRRKGGEEYEAFIIVGQRHFLFPTYFPTNFPLVSFSSVHCNLIKCSRKEFLNLEKNFFYFPITHRLQTGKPRNKKKKKSKEQN